MPASFEFFLGFSCCCLVVLLHQLNKLIEILREALSMLKEE